MALFVRQDDTRTKYQEKLAAELQEKAKQRGLDQSSVDGVEESKYLEGTKQTTGLAWLWVLITVVIIGGMFYVIFKG